MRRFGSLVRPSRKLRCSSSVRPPERVASRGSDGKPSRRRARRRADRRVTTSVAEPVARRAPSRSAREPRRAEDECRLATTLRPRTSAAVVCQPSVAGRVRSPPRKKAPSATCSRRRRRRTPPPAAGRATRRRASGRSARGPARGWRRRRCRARPRRADRPGVATRPLTAPRPAAGDDAAAQTAIIPSLVVSDRDRQRLRGMPIKWIDQMPTPAPTPRRPARAPPRACAGRGRAAARSSATYAESVLTPRPSRSISNARHRRLRPVLIADRPSCTSRP